jgi:hypothetical protein
MVLEMDVEMIDEVDFNLEEAYSARLTRSSKWCLGLAASSGEKSLWPEWKVFPQNLVFRSPDLPMQC